MENEIQMFAEVLPFFIVQMTDDLQNGPTPAAGFNLRFFLPNTGKQRPNHFRAIDEFLIENSKFHIRFQSLVSVGPPKHSGYSTTSLHSPIFYSPNFPTILRISNPSANGRSASAP